MSELEQYQEQLLQVLDLLAQDPENQELVDLKNNLEELVSLYQLSKEADLVDETNTENETKESAKEEEKEQIVYRTGQTVLAKWKDNRFHEAVITQLPSANSKLYTAIYTKYGSSEQVRYEDLKEFDAEVLATQSKKAAEKKRPASASNESKKGGEEVREKKKSKKKVEEELTTQKRQSWLDFSKGAVGKVPSSRSKPAPSSGTTSNAPYKRERPVFKKD